MLQTKDMGCGIFMRMTRRVVTGWWWRILSLPPSFLNLISNMNFSDRIGVEWKHARNPLPRGSQQPSLKYSISLSPVLNYYRTLTFPLSFHFRISEVFELTCLVEAFSCLLRLGLGINLRTSLLKEHHTAGFPVGYFGIFAFLS